MARFLIYLFESGLCLTLFYLGYVLFFRKETYFTFNRIYLLASMVMALILPLVPLQVGLDNAEYLSGTFKKVDQFRNYYEELILITDPDYQVAFSHSKPRFISEDSTLVSHSNSTTNFFGFSVYLLQILFYTYIVGLLFFSLRLVFLIYNLFRFITQNKVSFTDGFVFVFIKDEVPSFSFLRWIFVNKEILKPNEFEQVIAHEKVHVKHKHSVDLILAHIITMFQWFNPLTWRIQKSLKTCHEYIADRQVIKQGHELFDYQSLLLSQLISIRSVELVNNFNLLSIKKRIAMMNKIKSGRIAKLKALIVIPILMIAFMFFANMTGSGLLRSNISSAKLDIAEGMNLEKQDVSLPTAKEVKPFDTDFILCTLTLNKQGFFYNGVKHSLNEIDQLIASIDLSENKAKVNKMTVLLSIDKSKRMKEVDMLKKALRDHNLLKIGFLVQNKSSLTNEEPLALFMKLPPKDAKLIEESAVPNLYKIEQENRMNLEAISKDLTMYIYDHEKYVMLYKFDNATTFGEYINVVDMVFNSVNNLRRSKAKKEGKDYDSLTDKGKKVYRKRYPITLTQRNVDIE